MYAVGNLQDADKVLSKRVADCLNPFVRLSFSLVVEIGTGYYVQKTIPDANAFVNRKMVGLLTCWSVTSVPLSKNEQDYLKTQIAQIEEKLDEGMRNLEQVGLVIQQKGGGQQG